MHVHQRRRAANKPFLFTLLGSWAWAGQQTNSLDMFNRNKGNVSLLLCVYTAWLRSTPLKTSARLTQQDRSFHLSKERTAKEMGQQMYLRQSGTRSSAMSGLEFPIQDKRKAGKISCTDSNRVILFLFSFFFLSFIYHFHFLPISLEFPCVLMQALLYPRNFTIEGNNIPLAQRGLSEEEQTSPT